MDIVTQIKQALSAALDKLSATTKVVLGLPDFVNTLKSQNSALQAQVDALTAQAGSGTPISAADLQTISDGIKAINDGLDADAVTLAAVNNTSEAPTPNTPIENPNPDNV